MPVMALIKPIINTSSIIWKSYIIYGLDSGHKNYVCYKVYNMNNTCSMFSMLLLKPRVLKRPRVLFIQYKSSISFEIEILIVILGSGKED